MRIPGFPIGPLLALAACGPADENAPPRVAITSPESGAGFREGQTVTFVASLADDGGVRGLTLAWTVDGAPASGVTTVGEAVASLVVDGGFTVGEHTVALAAVDGSGASGEAAVTVDVSENRTPRLVLHAPDDGETYAVELPLLVHVEVSDRDDDPGDLALTWRGSLVAHADGPAAPDAGGLAIFDVEFLEVGTHTLGVTVTDPVGATDAEDATVEVVEGDRDGDGSVDEALGGGDCDDGDDGVFPGADDPCGDGVDGDCDGEDPEC